MRKPKATKKCPIFPERPDYHSKTNNNKRGINRIVLPENHHTKPPIQMIASLGGDQTYHQERNKVEPKRSRIEDKEGTKVLMKTSLNELASSPVRAFLAGQRESTEKDVSSLVHTSLF